jgi:hypothetical protein
MRGGEHNPTRAHMTQATSYIVGVGPITLVGLMTYDGKGAAFSS